MKKFDIYKFTAGKKDQRTMMTGVHYQNGEIQATDAMILASVKSDYDKSLEGRTIKEDGEDLIGKFPNFDWVKEDIDKATIGIRINPFKVLEMTTNARKDGTLKCPEDRKVFIEHNGVVYVFKLERLEKISLLMKHIDTDTLYVRKDPRRTAFVHSDKGWGAIMPICSPATLETLASPKYRFDHNYVRL